MEKFQKVTPGYSNSSPFRSILVTGFAVLSFVGIGWLIMNNKYPNVRARMSARIQAEPVSAVTYTTGGYKRLKAVLKDKSGIEIECEAAVKEDNIRDISDLMSMHKSLTQEIADGVDRYNEIVVMGCYDDKGVLQASFFDSEYGRRIQINNEFFRK
ncbi:hypothetical protein HY486_00510 [Candidatus Woesearchaeota archaeon]|nr:hypothetical protein [Candidatus Woesearchaeota archaeon]